MRDRLLSEAEKTEVVVAPIYQEFQEISEYIARIKNKVEKFKAHMQNSMQEMVNNLRELDSALLLINLDQEARVFNLQAVRAATDFQGMSVLVNEWLNSLTIDKSKELDSVIQRFNASAEQANTTIVLAKQKIELLRETNVISNSQPLDIHEEVADEIVMPSEVQPEVVVTPLYPELPELAEYIAQTKNKVEQFNIDKNNLAQDIANNLQELENAFSLVTLDEESNELILNAVNKAEDFEREVSSINKWLSSLTIDESKELDSVIQRFNAFYKQANTAIAIAKQKIALLLATNVISTQVLDAHDRSPASSVFDDGDFNFQPVDVDAVNDVFSPIETGSLGGYGFFSSSPSAGFLDDNFSNEAVQENDVQENFNGFLNF